MFEGFIRAVVSHQGQIVRDVDAHLGQDGPKLEGSGVAVAEEGIGFFQVFRGIFFQLVEEGAALDIHDIFKVAACIDPSFKKAQASMNHGLEDKRFIRSFIEIYDFFSARLAEKSACEFTPFVVVGLDDGIDGGAFPGIDADTGSLAELSALGRFPVADDQKVVVTLGQMRPGIVEIQMAVEGEVVFRGNQLSQAIVGVLIDAVLDAFIAGVGKGDAEQFSGRKARELVSDAVSAVGETIEKLFLVEFLDGQEGDVGAQVQDFGELANRRDVLPGQKSAGADLVEEVVPSLCF